MMGMPTRIPAMTLLAALTLGAAACSDPGPDSEPSEEAAATSEPAATDPLEEALYDEVRSLRATVVRAREHLAATRDGAGGAAELAVAALTADERLAEAESDVAPLFPGPNTSREENVDYGDAFTRTLTAARGASGRFASEVSHMLADPIAGDLGIWQRDAEGLLEAVDDAARARSVEEAETAVLELPGEGTRALAYALLAVRASDDDARSAYAERGIAHLDIVIRAIDTALGDEESTP